jgi:hypothetical protein
MPGDGCGTEVGGRGLPFHRVSGADTRTASQEMRILSADQLCFCVGLSIPEIGAARLIYQT